MAKTIGVRDTYGQMVYTSAYEAVANNGISTQFNPAGANQEATFALVIHGVEYLITPAMEALLLAADDEINFGLAAWSIAFAVVPAQTPGVLDLNQLRLYDFAGARAGQVRAGILRKDFGQLPGGGIICHPSSLYLWVKGTSLAAVVPGLIGRVFYTTTPLTPVMYQELFQMQIINSIVAGM